jgi:hypothetical protein
MKHLNQTDPAAFDQWLSALRVSVDDLASVADDALRPLRRRRLGHLEHVRIASGAKEQLADLLAYASTVAK